MDKIINFLMKSVIAYASLFSEFLLLLLVVFFLESNLQHMEVPRLGVKSELQLPAYATATATLDPSHFYDLHHGSQQRRILNPLIKARYRNHVLTDTSQVCYC